jgi:hypothetical protein
VCKEVVILRRRFVSVMRDTQLPMTVVSVILKQNRHLTWLTQFWRVIKSIPNYFVIEAINLNEENGDLFEIWVPAILDISYNTQLLGAEESDQILELIVDVDLRQLNLDTIISLSEIIDNIFTIDGSSDNTIEATISQTEERLNYLSALYHVKAEALELGTTISEEHTNYSIVYGKFIGSDLIGMTFSKPDSGFELTMPSEAFFNTSAESTTVFTVFKENPYPFEEEEINEFEEVIQVMMADVVEFDIREDGIDILPHSLDPNSPLIVKIGDISKLINARTRRGLENIQDYTFSCVQYDHLDFIYTTTGMETELYNSEFDFVQCQVTRVFSKNMFSVTFKSLTTFLGNADLVADVTGMKELNYERYRKT